MSFKDLGAFWRKADKNGDPYFSGTLNVEELVKAGPQARINVRRNQKTRDTQPDYTLSLAIDDRPKGPVDEYERENPDPYDDSGAPF